VSDARVHHATAKTSADMRRGFPTGLVAATVVLVGITLWSYWGTIDDLFREWQRNEDYSAGQLVPLVAVFLVWRERKRLRQCRLGPCWWGLILLLLAQAGRFFGLLFVFESAERYSLALMIAGLTLTVAGWQVFRRSFWILSFLFLMVPFPGQIHNRLNGPLQSMSTRGAVFLLEAFGVRVSQQGNVILLDGRIEMAVVEACSGLRMLTAFIIVGAFIAYMIRRARWQKATLLLSSIPVAVVCNMLRLVVTAFLFLMASSEVAEKFFHDFAGLVMMPAAVLIMFGELWLLDKLVLPEDDPERKDEVVIRARPAARH